MEPPYLTSGYGLTCEVYVLELDRCQHPEGTVLALPVVEDLEVLEHPIVQCDPRFPSFPAQEFGCILPENDSITALS